MRLLSGLLHIWAFSCIKTFCPVHTVGMIAWVVTCAVVCYSLWWMSQHVYHSLSLSLSALFLSSLRPLREMKALVLCLSGNGTDVLESDGVAAETLQRSLSLPRDRCTSRFTCFTDGASSGLTRTINHTDSHIWISHNDSERIQWRHLDGYQGFWCESWYVQTDIYFRIFQYYMICCCEIRSVEASCILWVILTEEIICIKSMKPIFMIFLNVI